MKLRLLRPYMTRPKGALLNTVPAGRAKRMIENGIAVLAEEKKPHKTNKKDA
jgi:hypothetical protein